jgi:VanZ family protein
VGQGIKLLRWRPFWLLLGWAYVVAICILSLLPTVPGMHEWMIPYQDKVFHLGAYMCMSLWFLQLDARPKLQCAYLMFFLCISVALEFLQQWGGHRYFELSDILANFAGLLLGALIARQTGISGLVWLESLLFTLLGKNVHKSDT